MTGSEQSDIHWSDLIAFGAGEADAKVSARVRQGMSDPHHPLAFLLQRTRGAKGQSLRNESSEALEEDTPESIDEIVGQSLRDEISAYLEWEQEQLEEALIAELPTDERELVGQTFRAGERKRWDTLKPYIAELRRVVGQEWNWPAVRDKEEYRDRVNLAVAVAEAFSIHKPQAPFPVALLAACVVKIGIERFAK